MVTLTACYQTFALHGTPPLCLVNQNTPCMGMLADDSSLTWYNNIRIFGVVVKRLDCFILNANKMA